ncbi:DHA2 family efflux MFS transporter permease subunit [Cohnella thailandensis]|uniref:DHA2 family efflux MFS transporter permease subunit n=1 Tax=Cohnella thailandensis TaxID=557557 RepID=A0A841SZT3_9BACL|nr:DHA2 family efflux MFS transporter permease subunit [Cohnella thailandensis]MBB6637414.1 DHA2 family efflux MFS transporter permease subunit [Cohnella thailandensis]MBP1976743.1 EmrB/QacA subfamily drug resistance transporter [Cohnella thailandensis]
MSAQVKQASPGSSGSIRSLLGPLVAIIVGLFMVILDGTAVNVAIPKLQEEFNGSLSLVQWTVTGYALAQAAIIPLAGWLSDRFGAKRIFLISVGLFTIGSLLCALANTAELLILFRVLQGLGGGVVMPIAMAFVYRLSPPDKVGVVMGMMGIPILLAPALGPVLAGWLVDYVTWNWIFLINLPIGVIAVLIGIRTLPNIDRQSVASLDLLGMILAPLAFAALSYGVTEGATSWTEPKTLIGIAVGVVALIAFVIVELRHKNPLLELRVFASGNFSRGIIVQWVSQFALFGSFFLVPIFLQTAKGYSAFETGLIMLPQAIASGIFMPIGGKLSDRFGARPLVLSGMTLVVLAAFFLSRVEASDGIISVMLPLALLGAGMGLFMMPLNTHLIQSAPQNLVGRVTSMTNAFQQVVSSLAIATLTTISGNRMKDLLVEAQKPAPGVEEWTSAFNYTFFILLFIGVAGVVLGLMLRRPKVDPNAEKSAEIHMMVG